jgi:hypothetical protein
VISTETKIERFRSRRICGITIWMRW